MNLWHLYYLWHFHINVLELGSLNSSRIDRRQSILIKAKSMLREAAIDIIEFLFVMVWCLKTKGSPKLKPTDKSFAKESYMSDSLLIQLGSQVFYLYFGSLLFPFHSDIARMRVSFLKGHSLSIDYGVLFGCLNYS